MFGDLLGNLESQQKELKQQLASLTVEGAAGDGAIKVVANANREIVNISIDPAVINVDDTEELEDLLLVALNRTLQLAAEMEAEETQKLLQNMLPPGFGDLGG